MAREANKLRFGARCIALVHQPFIDITFLLADQMMPSSSHRKMYLPLEYVSLCLPSKYLEKQRQGHLRGVQGYPASCKLPQYFFDGLSLTATICSVPPEVNGGVKGTYIEVIASLASVQ